MSYDQNFNHYTVSQKDNSSKASTVCTHKQEHSGVLVSKTKQDSCKALLKKDDCVANTECYWTPLYGIKFEKSGCAEAANLIGQELKKKTPETCDFACVMHLDCSEFSVGREHGASEGNCFLYKAGCTKLGNENLDHYVSSPKNTFCKERVTKVTSSFKEGVPKTSTYSEFQKLMPSLRLF